MANEKTRYVKTVKITYADVDKDRVESIVNGTVNIIKENGGKVVTYMQEVLGIGFSTVYLLYTIVYEREEEIPCEAFKKHRKGGKKASEQSDIE